MLTSLKPLLKVAHERNFAYGGFNVNSAAQIKAAIRIHEIMRSPAILQGAEAANAFMGGRADFMNATLDDKKKGMANLVALAHKYGDSATVPVVLHLDHGRSYEVCQAAVDAGYTSVMIDCSALPFEENMEITKKVVDYAHPRGVSVEGEIGVIAGQEDHVKAASSTYTNPLDAVEFVKATGVDALAISYGTAHGAVKGKNIVLRKEVPIAVNECLMRSDLSTALVSHGSSTVPQDVVAEINNLGGTINGSGGIPLDQLQAVVKAGGINKINVDTDIRMATTRNIRELWVKHPEVLKNEKVKAIYDLMQANTKAFDPRLYLVPILDVVMGAEINEPEIQIVMQKVEDAIQEVLCQLVVAFGSYHQAQYVEALTLDELKKTY
ncbi:class II fructose-bisphosphate aldolase [Amygdalobacter nucleatus]|uniref:class II fructose-bisphosphate aldolase n=1 Tax=Amygdalobacter nucleatus TaxID=3029274 RepID=UPI002799A3BE|nr:class II fructose-bisphosphate aldolase [Amygdalobacter nucleatus]WEG37273.1 class II fructose-bisphosphate aldolase [Amygdalobacter nucleatus]